MIEAKNLTKDYGTNRAANNVSFKVEKGDILGFLGPNGAGKSTTMKMLTGFIPPTEGTGSIGGHDIKENPLEAKKLFGYLPESGPLYQEMTVIEFLSFIADMRGYDDKDKKAKVLDRALKVCHLLEVKNQTIETLSKGYRQRVGLAQAVLHDPPCLILDEPTDGLDPNQKREVRKLIASMAKDKAIILSTHILEEVDAMCNRIIIIAKGKVIIDSTPQKLKEIHPGKSLEDIFCELTTAAA
jgi:ABC-2 type transport system ATP-binding protein